MMKFGKYFFEKFPILTKLLKIALKLEKVLKLAFKNISNITFKNCRVENLL